MTIRINRFIAIAFIVLLYPFVLLIRIVRMMTGHRKSVYKGTIDGDPIDYDGDKPLLIAV